jgi:hypothetical protein
VLKVDVVADEPPLLFVDAAAVVVGFRSVLNPPTARGATVIQFVLWYQALTRKGK